MEWSLILAILACPLMHFWMMKGHHHDNGSKKIERTTRDPVCGMEGLGGQSKITSKYKDKIYYFCSENCKKRFEVAPTDYISDINKQR